MNVEDSIKSTIRDIPDFPQPGILFKDLTPILKSPELCLEITEAFVQLLRPLKPDALVALESRGFWFSMMISTRLGIPMIPVRKPGKLPFQTIAEEYSLEYGTNRVEMHVDALKAGSRVVVMDDLLATGGTAEAAAKLVHRQESQVLAFAFVVELSALGGKSRIKQYSENIITLSSY
ncbi:MAG: adenine phosphoribosyltransferase [Cytophagaceae bacterium]|nr:adenine phosphoribosyltransferase [Cytophagaceae bacterium]